MELEITFDFALDTPLANRQDGRITLGFRDSRFPVAHHSRLDGTLVPRRPEGLWRHFQLLDTSAPSSPE